MEETEYGGCGKGELRMDSQYKKLVPCIYLYRGNAVKDFRDTTVVDTDPVQLAKFYSDNSADELLVFDLSDGDAEHEEALDIIKKICNEAEIPVTGAGNVHRMEDVKKLLYAGCKKAALNFSKQENIEITQEVSRKFGKDKIAVCYAQLETILDNRALIEEYVGELILVRASILRQSVDQWDGEARILTLLPEVSLDKLMEILSFPAIGGITGYAIDENVKELPAIKSLCQGYGIKVNTLDSAFQWKDFKKNEQGHVTVVTQDYKTDEVLMVAYMDEEAYETTLRTGKMTYYSRSRKELWVKGETSGHFQYVKSLTADCDMDAILAKVSQVGAACHTGNRSCFFHEIYRKEYEETNPLRALESVMGVIKERKVHPKEGSYTNYLFDKGIDKISYDGADGGKGGFLGGNPGGIGKKVVLFPAPVWPPMDFRYNLAYPIDKSRTGGYN